MKPNTQYYFRVCSCNDVGGESDDSDIAGVKTLINVAAILINIEGTPLQYLVKQSSVQVSNTIEVRDNIHPTLASATISVAANYNSLQDLLLFTNQNGITGTWDPISGSMFLKGNVSPAVYQAALRTVQYKNTSTSPNVLDRTISYTVNDGYDNSNLQSRTIKFMITGVEDLGMGIPAEYELYQNYPNPFNPSTKIRFALPTESNIKVSVFNMLGEEVATLVEGVKNAGYYQVEFDAAKLSAGVYFYRIVTGNFVQVKKMLLIK